jgi:hypothetical protein
LMSPHQASSSSPKAIPAEENIEAACEMITITGKAARTA